MKRTWQLGNALALVFALVANFLTGAQILDLPPINEVSDKYATYLTPAGYAFSIWTLIYLLLIVFAVYQARDLRDPRDENDVPLRLGPLFIIASICNGLWTYVFVKEWVGLSVIVLLTLTATLYAALWRLGVGTTRPSTKDFLMVWLPLMLYTGWVTAASIVNIATYLDSKDVTVSPLASTVVIVVLTAALLFLLLKRNLRELLFSCAWALVAVGLRQLQLSQSTSVAIVALVCAGVLVLAMLVHAMARGLSYDGRTESAPA
ncbi:tryptophan-rich sensory protein [Nocardioides sp. NPDC057577]|uniref:tryptophan-rich sensory protein n=1 Tax=Nocardioides sp. NPDC057577 TaxID=3346171 RepID=UPI00366B1910